MLNFRGVLGPTPENMAVCPEIHGLQPFLFFRSEHVKLWGCIIAKPECFGHFGGGISTTKKIYLYIYIYIPSLGFSQPAVWGYISWNFQPLLKDFLQLSTQKQPKKTQKTSWHLASSPWSPLFDQSDVQGPPDASSRESFSRWFSRCFCGPPPSVYSSVMVPIWEPFMPQITSSNLKRLLRKKCLQPRKRELHAVMLGTNPDSLVS